MPLQTLNNIQNIIQWKYGKRKFTAIFIQVNTEIGYFNRERILKYTEYKKKKLLTGLVGWFKN